MTKYISETQGEFGKSDGNDIQAKSERDWAGTGITNPQSLSKASPQDKGATRLQETESSSLAMTAADIEALFYDHHNDIFTFFRRRGAELEEARFLSLETFVQAFRGRSTFRGDINSKTWLYGIARNVWHKRNRDTKALKRDGQELPLEPDSEDERNELTLDAGQKSSVKSRSITAKDIQRLWAAVDGLPEHMRCCFVLRFIADSRYWQIADELSIPVDDVKPHLFNARKRLKQSLTTPLPPPK